MESLKLELLRQKKKLMYGGRELKDLNVAKRVFQFAFKNLTKVLTIQDNNSLLFATLFSAGLIEAAEYNKAKEQHRNYTQLSSNFFDLLYNKAKLPDILNKLVNLNDTDLSDYQQHINQIFTSIDKVSITDEIEAIESVPPVENEHSSLVNNRHLDSTYNQENISQSSSQHSTTADQDSVQRSGSTVFYLNLIFWISYCTAVVLIGVLLIIYFIVTSSCSCVKMESCLVNASFRNEELLVTDKDNLIKSRSEFDFPANDVDLPYNIFVNSTDELTQQQLQICNSSFVNLTIDFNDPKKWHSVVLNCPYNIKILIFKGFFSLRNVGDLLSQISRGLYAVEIYCDRICVANDCTPVQHDNSGGVTIKSFGKLTLWASNERSDCNTVLEYLGNDSRFSFSKLLLVGIPITFFNLPFINRTLNNPFLTAM